MRWDLRSSEPAEPRFLEPHDLAAAKLVAGRDKDLRFVSALLAANLLTPAVVQERLGMIDGLDEGVAQRITSWLAHGQSGSR